MLAQTTPLSLGMSADYGLLSSHPVDARLTVQCCIHSWKAGAWIG